MADIRKRKTADEKPTKYTVDDFSSAVLDAQESATEKGVEEKEFLKFLKSAAEKNKVKLVKEPKKPRSKKTSKPSSKWRKFLLCYKALIILNIIIVILYGSFLYSPTISALVIKVNNIVYSHVLIKY